MANITEKNGKFHVRVFRKGGGAVCKSFAVRKDAINWGKATEADIQAGRWQPASVTPCMTLKAALTRYKAEVTPAKKGAAPEAYIIGAIMAAKITAKKLSEIKGVDIAALRDQWKAEELAAATIVRRMAILSHVFEVAAKEWGVDTSNPVKLVSKPKVNNARERRLLDGELDAVLAASGSVDLPAVARLAVATAMRLSEIVGLRWADVSLTNRTAALSDTKNGSARTVPLSPEALKTLSALPRRIDGALFSVDSHSISTAWRRAVKRAREVYEAQCKASGTAASSTYLVDLHIHDLRHESTSRLFEMGVFNVMEIASITGHKTMQMLARYTHVQASRLADKLAQG